VRSLRNAPAWAIELCANLSDGGTTPSAPHGKWRPSGRASRLCADSATWRRIRFTDDELAVMEHDIELGLSLDPGFAVGALTSDAGIDAARTSAFVRAAKCALVTFHRRSDFAAIFPKLSSS